MARDSMQAYYNVGRSISDKAGLPEKDNELETLPSQGNEEGSLRTSDREELIQCIKRGERPTWVPRPGLEALCAEVNAEQREPPPQTSHTEESAARPILALGPGEHDRISPNSSRRSSATEALRSSLSALHTGDFHDDYPQTSYDGERAFLRNTSTSNHLRGNSPPLWPSEFPSTSKSLSPRDHPSHIIRRSRAPSLGSSLSQSFVMRIPTSPLVHSINNSSLDFSPRDSPLGAVNRGARRRTMPPNAFESFRMPMDTAFSASNSPMSASYTHHDGTVSPHRPRRSLSSFTYQPTASQQVSFSASSRRPSVASDASPRQRASMVGSFEESILRGRMSTPPSKPLDFVAQIGVVGKGNCPASLKCPAHVTVPFPAVFYNYPSSSGSRSISDDNPSPYVGTIDLERNLNPPDPPARKTRRDRTSLDAEDLVAEITSPENTAIGKALARDTREKQAAASKRPAGGSYRVPQKGQLQIIIKNPNKTAVKLFLIPYDLEGMLPGTKTFVRQRSFSSGPILENALAETAANVESRDPLSNKDILRYLIHLKFCSTAKGRFYLYDDVRVVFANRVPDGKEKLRNEIQLPEPRFSPYKPPTEAESRSPSIHNETPSPTTRTVTSSRFGSLDNMLRHDFVQTHATSRVKSSDPFNDPPNVPSEPADTEMNVDLSIPGRQQEAALELERPLSPISGFLPSTSRRGSPVPWLGSSGSPVARTLSSTPVEAGDGLISRKLRELNGDTAGRKH
ncbi:hypothetical protein LTS07_005333 [Exophiala sideris]|uniref:Atos-like conserved domain-containing protein n=1 Tax=Exophiala sideris TaxID=1016849 RepID=A0ABR0JAZ6_9EURO|nr:hypothetical protein LTS07_005333 [Exophiala sideris]KAK5038603.1 hypothetical protein LTR13_004350 [Exophiala sideris]KAK5060484.1 hypothetical protein LTR69_005801 [Exophiala sideris]KAK5183396.1 hypothetical protein LTR44_004397 [Eurotiomycetes sp. CCFEE 6388]